MRKKTGIFLTAMMTLVFCVQVSAASENVSSNKLGVFEGFNYELWKDGGDGNMTLTGGGKYECEWNDSGNVLFRTGKKFDQTKTHDELGGISVDYNADYRPNGNSYLCIYGWSVDPLVEFYVVESWGSWRPPGATSKGTIEVDGGTYDVYETTRRNQPSIQGTKTFQQYWSVRTDKKTGGTVSVSEHIEAWEEMGMELGKMYEVALCVEGYQSSGRANITKHVMTIGDDSLGGTKSASASEAANPDTEEAEFSPEVLGTLVFGIGAAMYSLNANK
ncbi:MAG: glycoside hydrolase family 11 protein [Clostridiales bacterium]|jgi:endo-1,4-beta-xylanase|nr:glycoside hydrolase family 11 protein [Clostridiales bacterium]